MVFFPAALVQQDGIDLLAELGNLIANVSSLAKETSVASVWFPSST